MQQITRHGDDAVALALEPGALLAAGGSEGRRVRLGTLERIRLTTTVEVAEVGH